MKKLQTEEQRRSAIAWAIALTAETALAPDQYEWAMLERYAQGDLTLTEVITQLDARVHHLLYHSQATRPLSSADLTDLVEKSLAWNDAHNITGMLCYSNGHFVQVLEGAAIDVQALFTKIRQDRRHHQVVALSERASEKRWFADWRMAFIDADLHEVYWLLGYLEAKGHNLVKPQFPLIPSHLMTLVQQFSNL
ncbi:MAG: hypothetical protein EOO62_01020 [Hymenobacter sp.]|nr:MAG: hypothetical protein EOO62_01020 [Hymenobacter sp.]